MDSLSGRPLCRCWCGLPADDFGQSQRLWLAQTGCKPSQPSNCSVAQSPTNPNTLGKTNKLGWLSPNLQRSWSRHWQDKRSGPSAMTQQGGDDRQPSSLKMS
ncbi:hypothetical protein O181_016334 [Austropuccinia psidii MF-1]|uniref:Uncharacterized protein n=1 Tax=Austropuccinia psidii MF-1 TaxID=1389203 RepID=A0A9Q3GRQ0_9BASI|nr:hypothetical protein [Austropuccinia psidii MF-1]